MIARLFGFVFLIATIGAGAMAADPQDKLRSFLNVTGFDVALDSIRFSAGSAPSMLGIDSADFGTHWSQQAEEVFDSAQMQAMALDMLGEALTAELVGHANTFYASDLGQRIVRAENASHMVTDDAAKSEAGEAIFAALVQHGSSRVDTYKRMLNATDSTSSSVRAAHEVQLRFLMSAASAGVIKLRTDEAGLRALFAEKEAAHRRRFLLSSLASAAYTYQAFSDEEVADYVAALEDPKMKKVYAVMNAVQYEIMANRFEHLAQKLTGLGPSSEL